jgi:hypothetical protein
MRTALNSQNISDHANAGTIRKISRNLTSPPTRRRSRRTVSWIPGRRTLIATRTPPDLKRASWIWPMLAAAIGSGEKLSNISSTEAPRSASMISRDTAPGKPGSVSWARDISSQKPAGKRSRRMPRNWASFVQTQP